MSAAPTTRTSPWARLPARFASRHRTQGRVAAGRVAARQHAARVCERDPVRGRDRSTSTRPRSRRSRAVRRRCPPRSRRTSWPPSANAASSTTRVTGSGGMFVGRVLEIGPALAARDDIAVGDRIASLVSLTLTPLQLDAIDDVDVATGQVRVRGKAILFESGIYARLPDDLPTDVALAVLDVAGAPAQVRRLAQAGADGVRHRRRRQVRAARLRAGARTRRRRRAGGRDRAATPGPPAPAAARARLRRRAGRSPMPATRWRSSTRCPARCPNSPTWSSTASTCAAPSWRRSCAARTAGRCTSSRWRPRSRPPRWAPKGSAKTST